MISVEEVINIWRDVKPNDLILLTDDQSKVVDPGGVAYEIERIHQITTKNIEYLIFDLLDVDEEIFLCIKIISDDNVEFFIYFEPEEHRSKTKQKFFEEFNWLFESIAPSKKVDINKVKFAKEFTNTYEVNNKKITTSFTIKDQGVICGESRYTTINDFWGPLFTELVEFESKDEKVNPEVLILNVQDLQNPGEHEDQGGFIRFFMGCKINSGEIEIFE